MKDKALTVDDLAKTVDYLLKNRIIIPLDEMTEEECKEFNKTINKIANIKTLT